MHDEPRFISENGCVDWLAARHAFYAEFTPLQAYANFIDRLYVMKDRGLMTADRRTFASPLVEIAFLFTDAMDRTISPPRVVVVEPSFGPVSYTHLTLPTNREV